MPKFKTLNRDVPICSHAFINTIDFSKDERIKIDFTADKNILIERFKQRERIKESASDKNIELYYKSYEEVLKDSISNILETTDKDVIKKITNLIFNYYTRKENSIIDLKIKAETGEFHGRTCGIIKQENKFLIMRVNKTSYYHIPGGHIEIEEDSEQAVIHEIKEEIGCDVQETNLFAIQENFWTRNNKKCHGIEFVQR